MSVGTRLARYFIKSVIWNQENLPDNTLEMQLKKIEEEIEEGREKTELGLVSSDEIADVFIATAGLARFDKELSMHLMINVLSGLPITLEELADEVEKKLKILQERNYTIINGVYRHETLQ